MGVSIYPIPSSGGGSLKSYVVTLLSGTSWTVPTGVTNINATLQGGGGGGAGSNAIGTTQVFMGEKGNPGQMITTNIATTPGASITYAIGAGGTGGAANTAGGNGGTTTLTGATSAIGGVGGKVSTTAGPAGTQAAGYDNSGGGGGGLSGSGANTGGVGGAGQIIVEYWV